MTSVTGFTAERMQEIEDGTVVDGSVVGDDLILEKHDGTTINAGNVRGPDGPPGSTSTIRPTARATVAAGAQAAPIGVTVVNFPTEDFDTDSMHDLVTNNSRLTINTEGIYLIHGFVEASRASNGIFNLDVLKNGGLLGPDPYMLGTQTKDCERVAVSGIAHLVVTDYIQIRFINNSANDTVIGRGVLSAVLVSDI